MAFPSIDSGPISDISIRIPSGLVTLVMNEIVLPTRGSSTVTPLWRSTFTAAFAFSTWRPK